ncbi:MAG: N-acetylmuramoyl-L-alanine amidase [Ignavibacteriales bacterium]|nr:N-acetylmuramoyl-L-alanine amidase [Ignavibacteriales bacterium]
MMKFPSRILLAVVVFLSPASGQVSVDTTRAVQYSDSLFLRVVLPEADTVQAPYPRHRIAASTTPGARAFLNGVEAKVYPTGAFVGMMNLDVGENRLNLTAVSQVGDSISRDFILIRPEGIRTSSKEELTIESILMEPSEDRWLGSGDVLEVRFKGSPGYEASFSISNVESGIPMTELAAKEAAGIEGVYVGRYQVREDDEAREVPVEFKLRKSFWSSERAESKGKVSILPRELPRVAELTGRRPFLNVGLGDDRLGGAKLGYLQPGVRMTVTGKVGRQYRVRLSEVMTAWLPQDFAKLLPPETPAPKSLVGSIMATGGGGEDLVVVALSQKLPFTTELQVNPAAIIVDVFGATSNTNWITHHLAAEGIESVFWDQRAEDHYRLTIRLKHQSHWGFDAGYENGTALRIRIRRPPRIAAKDSVLRGMKIAVDAGHGGDNQGALGATGAREMDITLAIAKHLEELLRAKGATVVMTRSDDSGSGMVERAEKVLASYARILVSIHCNSIGVSTDPERTKGTSTYYRYVGFKPLANILYDKMLELGFDQFGVVGSFNFALNAPTQMPNVLVETAFLSHPEDEMKLLDDALRRQIAVKIVEGLEQFTLTYALPTPG